MCLCFGSGESMLDGYTVLDILGDVDFKKSISGFLMTFAREMSFGNLSCINVLHYPLQKLNTLLLLRVIRKLCG